MIDKLLLTRNVAEMVNVALMGENWFLRSNMVSRHDMRGLGPGDLPTRLVYGAKMEKYVLRRVIFHSGKHGGVITTLSIIDFFFWCEAKIAITMDATMEPATQRHQSRALSARSHCSTLCAWYKIDAFLNTN